MSIQSQGWSINPKNKKKVDQVPSHEEVMKLYNEANQKYQNALRNLAKR